MWDLAREDLDGPHSPKSGRIRLLTWPRQLTLREQKAKLDELIAQQRPAAKPGLHWERCMKYSGAEPAGFDIKEIFGKLTLQQQEKYSRA
jgi:uncharacterized protein YbjT (DUF2867 family)